MNFQTMNKERHEVDAPAYCVNARKWYVRVSGQEGIFLHNDQTIRFGTAVEHVPGEKTWSGYYSSVKEAKIAMRNYDTKWEVEEWALDVDEELTKALQAVL